MNNFKYIILALLLGSATLNARAQSSSFSQYQLTPMYTSPAELGTTDYFQVLGHYRKQALTQDQGYKNMAVSAVYPLYYKEGGRRFGGLGIGLMNEQSGMMGMLNETNLRAGYAYNLQLSSAQYVSIGLSGGYYRRNISFENITTEAQYQNGVYVPGLPSGENFSGNVSQAFKADAGASWYAVDADGDQKFSLGLAAFNVNQSTYQFLESGNEQSLPVTWQVYGSLRALRKDKLQLVPTFRYVFEKNYGQLNLGSLFLYQLGEGISAMHENHIGLGVWYSVNNAAILAIQLSKPNYQVSMSYDMPASASIDHLQVNNGVELTLGWRINKGKGRKARVSEQQPLTTPIAENRAAAAKVAPVETEAKTPEASNSAAVADQPGVATVEPKKAVVPEKKPEDKIAFIRKEIDQKVPFEVGSAELSGEGRSEVERISALMLENPAIKVKITGHTCTLGTEKLNQGLSLERAEAAKKAMVERGIDPDRILTEGRGFQEPISSNDTEQGRRNNRRVAFKLIE